MSKNNLKIRYIENGDKKFWFSLDKHLPEAEFAKKVRDKQGYILLADDKPAAILRYNLFWDNTPFCNLLYVKEQFQNNGYGKALMNRWENEMQASGYGWILVSARSDESARHFYRKLGYKDCGTLTAPNQPDELFLCKFLSEINYEKLTTENFSV